MSPAAGLLAAWPARLPWEPQTSLWFTLQRRTLYVQGCVAAGFDRARFLARFLQELAQTADVDTVVDQAFVNGGAQAPPYPVAAGGTAAAAPPPALGSARQR